MSQAIFNATVSAKAKEGFADAGRALYGQERTMTRLYNEIGERFADQLEALSQDGAIPSLRLRCELIVDVTSSASEEEKAPNADSV